jgi:hypothetical protein
MAKNSNRRSSTRSQSRSGGMMDLARERPIAAAAVAAGAAATGLFLWSKRNQISQQLSSLSDQIGEWTENMTSGSGSDTIDDTGGLTRSTPSESRSGAGSRSASGTRSRSTGSRNRGMSETGAGNASLGAASGGAGISGASPSGQDRASDDS